MKYLRGVFNLPGVVVHELGHLLFCFLTGVKVFRVKLFSFGKVSGFVEHGSPSGFFSALGISFGPLMLNSLVALVAFSQIRQPYFSFINAILIWIGLSVSLHAIPSTGDARTLFLITNSKIKKNPAVVLGYPFVGIIYFFNFLENFHLQFLYAAFLFYAGDFFLK